MSARKGPNLFRLCETYNWTCHLCGNRVPRFTTFNAPDAATRDHIIPRVKAKNIENNVALAHAYCNSMRHDLSLDKIPDDLFAEFEQVVRKFYGFDRCNGACYDVGMINTIQYA